MAWQSAMRLAVSLALLTTAACDTKDPGEENRAADLAILGARVWTGVAAKPWAEAVSTRGDRILAVGTRSEIEATIAASTEVVELAGGLVVPGFIDTHVHFLDGGFGLASVQLRDASTPDTFARRLADFTEKVPTGAWILNGNWDHEQWGGELPHRDWIDPLTPEHPVFVNRLDGHMALANSAALEAAGLLDTDAALEVEGGEVVRDASGRLTGVLKDNAMDIVRPVIPAPSPELEDRALAAASRYVLEQGVTTVHHMGTWSDLAVFERARDSGALALSIAACVPLATSERLAEKVEREGPRPVEARLRIGCLKGMVDGSLGSHTAAFLEPYSDRPEDGSGLWVTPIEDIEQQAAGADAAGLQVDVHAIGDRAIRDLLDAFEHVAQKNGAKDRRFRIEHAQHIHPDDLPRFAEQQVIASMQPYHAIDDGRWATKVIGELRSETTYAFRSLLDSGAGVAFGSDWPVAPATPLEGIYAAVTRRTIDDAHPDGWVPSQKITVEEALYAYTLEAARAGFEEHEKGTIETGKRADLAVLDVDITALPLDRLGEIRDASVVLTLVGGAVAHAMP